MHLSYPYVFHSISKRTLASLTTYRWQVRRPKNDLGKPVGQPSGARSSWDAYTIFCASTELREVVRKRQRFSPDTKQAFLSDRILPTFSLWNLSVGQHLFRLVVLLFFLNRKTFFFSKGFLLCGPSYPTVPKCRRSRLSICHADRRF